jgi:poly [ADP-ribose] polymerase
VGTADKNIGVMFLNEVALGKEKHIVRDDCSLKAAPPGFDSVVAQGHTEPDPAADITRLVPTSSFLFVSLLFPHLFLFPLSSSVFDGHEVTIPQGKPIQRPEYKSSTFSQTEYLVYKESQVRIRYLLKMQF